MSHLSRMKNPDLPYPSIAAALRAYSYVLSSLDVRSPWEPLLPSLAYPKLGFTPARPYQLVTVSRYLVISHILTIPYTLSLVNHCYIRLASPPPRAIEGVRGIHPFYRDTNCGICCALGIFYA
jgi:hypothetical protein